MEEEHAASENFRRKGKKTWIDCIYKSAYYVVTTSTTPIFDGLQPIPVILRTSVDNWLPLDFLVAMLIHSGKKTSLHYTSPRLLHYEIRSCQFITISGPAL